jgi:hypothetical protein
MKSAVTEKPISTLLYRTRVRHLPSGRCGIIIRILENPSQRPENQWYDIHFDDGTYGRFLTKELKPE